MAERPRVYLISRRPELAQALRAALPLVEVKDLQRSEEQLTEADLEDVVQNAEIVLGGADHIADVMYLCRKLKWAQTISAGVDRLTSKIDPQKPLPEVTITRTVHGYGKSMTEYVLGYILSIERELLQMFAHQQQRIWNRSKFKHFRSLSDLRLGVLGAGNIGYEIGRKCKALGMEVWGLTRSRSCDSELDQLDVYKTVEELPEFLENCDYICSVLPNTPGTTDLLSGDVLSHCKSRKSVLINIGRGNVIDEESIVKALTNGWISHAVLDVFRKEPLPQDSKLWTLPNVYITPHIAGPTKPATLAEEFTENYTRYINGQRLNCVLNLKKGY